MTARSHSRPLARKVKRRGVATSRRRSGQWGAVGRAPAGVVGEGGARPGLASWVSCSGAADPRAGRVERKGRYGRGGRHSGRVATSISSWLTRHSDDEAQAVTMIAASGGRRCGPMYVAGSVVRRNAT